MQVDPIKPSLKPPGTERLKMKCDVLLSTVAFKFNLRRYSSGAPYAPPQPAAAAANRPPRAPPPPPPAPPPAMPQQWQQQAGAAARPRRVTYSSGERLAAGAYTRPLLSST